jgi:hypothetical protein
VETTNEPAEQLLAALLRSDMRRSKQETTFSMGLSDTIHSRLIESQTKDATKLESLARKILSTPAPAAASERRQKTD